MNIKFIESKGKEKFDASVKNYIYQVLQFWAKIVILLPLIINIHHVFHMG